MNYEDFLINSLKRFERKNRRIPIRIGDDCTYLEEKGNKYLVVSVDSLTEHVHFELSWLTGFDIGYKAMASALSDLAAKGASPLLTLVDLHIPEYIEYRSIIKIYEGMYRLARKYGFSISGGNVSRDSRLSISMSVLGELDRLPPTRSGAKTGDYVYVTGSLGKPALFVKMFSEGIENIPQSVRSKFLYPIPKFKTAKFILQNHRITSIMDVSDGLGMDISRIARASKKNIVIFEEAIPASPVLKKYVKEPGIFALHSGEEYELLFTSPDYIDIKGVHRVGIVGKKGGVVFLKSKTGELIDISEFGFDHLRQE